MSNRKPYFLMMVGLPSSGKSTYTKELANEIDAIICSSDAIRKELCNDENSQDKNDEVFNILHKRIKDNLKNGINVICDATNINSKRRRAFLSELKKILCVKKCVIMAVPFEECCRVNETRDRVVPCEVIERMYKNWNTPYWFESWEIGNIGFIASFNGRWFDGGYAKTGYEKTKNGLRLRNYYQEAKNNILAQAPDLKDIKFFSCDYKESIELPYDSGMVIYCDPPYKGTK